MVIGLVFGRVSLHGLSKGANKRKGVLGYTIVQVIGSNLILVGLRISDFFSASNVMVLVGFLIKVGLYPFHM